MRGTVWPNSNCRDLDRRTPCTGVAGYRITHFNGLRGVLAEGIVDSYRYRPEARRRIEPTTIIDTEGHAPIKQLPQRTPFALRKKIEEMIQEMLERGVITHSHSPRASPVVLVAKKDGITRFFMDYRRLNSIARMDTFLLPMIDDSLDLLANTAYFTTLDLKSGYWQVGRQPFVLTLGYTSLQ